MAVPQQRPIISDISIIYILYLIKSSVQTLLEYYYSHISYIIFIHETIKKERKKERYKNAYKPTTTIYHIIARVLHVCIHCVKNNNNNNYERKQRCRYRP